MLLVAVAVGLALRLYFFTGLIASDDLTHAYAARHFWGDPTEGLMGPADAYTMSANAQRFVVNFFMWLSTTSFGVHEWSYSLVPLLFSVAGVIVCFWVLRMLAGTGAGLAGAWLWAVLPGDVYSATVWMGDNLFATSLLFGLGCVVASERSRRPTPWLFAAGLVFGAMQYIKGTGFMVFGGLGLWAIWSSWVRKRIDTRILIIFAGWCIAQLMAGLYFWRVADGPTYYWRSWFAATSAMLGRADTVPNAFPENFAKLWSYLRGQWLFGYLGPAVLVFAGLALWRDRRNRSAAVLFTAVLVVQTYVLSEGLKWGSWTQRYMLQISTPVVVLTVLGAKAASKALIDRLEAHRWHALGPVERRARRRIWGAIATAGLVLLTLTPMSKAHQQHRRDRAVVVRDAFHYLDRVAGADEIIYIDESTEVPYYTKRAFAVLAGYRPFKGGFEPLARAYGQNRGWVVLTHLEERHRRLRSDKGFTGIPDNWLLVFESTSRRGRYYGRVYRVLPHPPRATTYVVRDRSGQDDATMVLPDSALTAVDWPLDLDSIVAERWIKNARSTIDLDDEGVALQVTAVAPESSATAPRHVGGIRIFAPTGVGGVKLRYQLDNSDSIIGVFIYLANAAGQRTIWQLDKNAASWDGAEHLAQFTTNYPAADFRLKQAELSPAAVESVYVLVRVKPGTTAGIRIKDLRLAPSP